MSGRVLDRGQWVDSNITSMRTMLAPLTDKFGERLAHSPFAPISRRVAATEMGGLARLHGPARARAVRLARARQLRRATRCTTSAATFSGLEKRFAFRPADFRLWIAIHEVTHRAQFTGVPWMRPYFLGLVREAMDLVDPDPRTLARAFTRAADEVRAGRNPLDDGGVVGLFASPEQRGVLGQVTALMSVLEGHGNVVMDDLGKEHVAGQERMSRVLSQRRKQGGLTSLLHKLLGIEQKMRQYEVGEEFVRGVYAEAGTAAFDVVWERPENLPTVPELKDPAAWLTRVGPPARV